MMRPSQIRRRLRRYAVFVAASFFVVAVLAGLSLVFLARTGDYSDIDAIVEGQHQPASLYNGVSRSMASYKYAMYLDIRPEIVVIGTSRAMQVREYDFNRPFYNLGGLVQGAGHAIALGEKLFTLHQPDTVIFFLDYWAFPDRGWPARPQIDKVGFTSTLHYGMGQVNRLAMPWHLLAEGRVSLSDFWSALVGDIDRQLDGLTRYGVFSVLEDYGFGPDGSYYDFQGYHQGSFSGPLESRWQGQLVQLDERIDHFEKGYRASAKALDELEHLVSEWEARGIHVVLIIPPVAPAIADQFTLHATDYAYIEDWRREMSVRFGDFHDFHDFHNPRELGALPCEFMDGLHGGEAVYARMLQISARTPGSALASLVDLDLMDQIVSEKTGYLIVPWSVIGKARANLIETAFACERDDQMTSNPGS